MPPLRLTAPWPLFSLMLLTACGSAPEPRLVVQDRVERLSVPDGLLSCQDEPEPPPGPLTQRDVGILLRQVADAGQDCRDKLSSVRALVTPPSPAKE